MSGSQEPVTADVAIVGGGFSGTMLAAQLARRGLSSVIIEKAGRAGRGAAFSTLEPSHLLNVPAGRMSAWPDRPDDFVAWLEAQAADGAVGPDGFAQRRHFGVYLSAILDQAKASGLVHVFDGEAVAARPSTGSGQHPDGAGWRVTLGNGVAVDARILALANGNQPPDALRLPGAENDKRVVSDPWSAAAAEQIAQAARNQAAVLIVGTGLTMIDVVLSLNAARHDGLVTAVSRRGLLHQPHAEGAAGSIEAGEVPAGLLPLWRWVRGGVAGGADWRELIDSLRPMSGPLWRGLSVEEQTRFMRHARPWWDVHRHRIAPAVAQAIETRRAKGRLEIIAGRIARAEASEAGIAVTIGRRRGGEAVREVQLVINSTGPLHALARTRDPLLRQMLDDRLIAPDPLGIGIACGE
ncbi:MAG: FAD-dependent oxidoreductase, partial [Sphingomicrobium sp.]